MKANLIYKSKQELKRGLTNTVQISEPPQRGRASLKFVIIQGAEEAKLGYGKESPSQKLIRLDKGGITKPFEKPITYNNGRVDTTKTPRPTEPSNLLSTLLLPLAS